MNLNDNTEFEAKFYPVNKEEYRKKLQSIGAKLSIPERKMIRFVGDIFANPSFHKNNYIRVRDEGSEIRVSYKTTTDQSGKLTDQKEIDVTVSDFNKMVKILELAGITFNKKQETLREEWEFNGANITIDTWPGLSTYSEIEAESEEKVKKIAILLDFNWDKKIITTAFEIFQKTYGLPNMKLQKMISNVTFENNPFANLKKVWAPKTQNEG